MEDIISFLNHRFTPEGILLNKYIFSEINQHLELSMAFLMEFDVINKFMQSHDKEILCEVINRSETLNIDPQNRILSINFNGERLKVLQVSQTQLSSEARDKLQEKLDNLKTLISQQRVGQLILVKIEDNEEYAHFLEEASQLGCKVSISQESMRDAFVRSAIQSQIITNQQIMSAQAGCGSLIGQRGHISQHKGNYTMTPEEFKRESGYNESVPSIDLSECLGYLYTVEIEDPININDEIFGEPQKIIVQQHTQPRFRQSNKRQYEYQNEKQLSE